MKLTLKNEAQFDLNKWKVIIKENLRTEEIIVQIIKLAKTKRKNRNEKQKNSCNFCRMFFISL